MVARPCSSQWDSPELRRLFPTISTSQTMSVTMQRLLLSILTSCLASGGLCRSLAGSSILQGQTLRFCPLDLPCLPQGHLLSSWGRSPQNLLHLPGWQPLLPRQVFLLLRHFSRNLWKPGHAGGKFCSFSSGQVCGAKEDLEASLEEKLSQEKESKVGKWSWLLWGCQGCSSLQ